MVRLRGPYYPGRKRLLDLFQFLYGAIKGKVGPVKVGPSKVFQFLYGAIKGITNDVTQKAKRLISIPVWCD